jgi:hypothetical protein
VGSLECDNHSQRIAQVLDAHAVHGRGTAEAVTERLAPSGSEVIHEVAQCPGMGAVQPGYLLVRAGVAMTSADTPWTLPAALGRFRGTRAEHAALTAAHLVQAVT